MDAVKKECEDKGNLFSSEVEDFDRTVGDAMTIMDAYFKYWRKDQLDYVKVGKRRTEHEFEYDLGQGVVVEGIIDCIPETPDGRRWLGEHKSHKNIPTEDVRMRDMQTMLYADAARNALGVKGIGGVLWDYLRSKSPTVPQMLKAGTLSKAKIDTLPSVYEKAIADAGLEKAHYSDILGNLDDKMSSWFKRVFLPLNRSATAQLIDETRTTAREMVRKAGVDKTRSISRDCSFCSYERLCHAELFGLDADMIREREFHVKVSKNEVEHESD
jgi:hypothetical protein